MTFKHITKLIFLSVVLLFAGTAHSQKSKVDSLRMILYANIANPEKAQENLALLEKLYEYSYQSNLMDATEFAGQAKQICDSLLDDSLKAVDWQIKLSNMYFLQNDMTLAMEGYTQINDFYKKNGTQKQIAYSIQNIGKIYSALGVSEIALQKFQEANNIFSEINDTEGIVITKNKVAEVYYDTYEVDTAFFILYQNLPLLKELSSETKAETFFTIAKLYHNDFEIDSAIKYYDLALLEYQKNNDKFKQGNIFYAKGESYTENEDYKAAETNLLEAIKIFEQKDAGHKLADCYNKLGESKFYQGNHKEALEIFNQAMEVAVINDLSLPKQTAYKFISDIYKEKGDTQKALEYLTYYNEEKDKFYEQNTKEGFAGVIVLSQNKEKQKEIELLEKEDALKSQKLRSSRQLTYIGILLIIFFLAFTVYFFYSSRKQKKQNDLLQEQYDKINFQKKEIESQAKILEKATRSIMRQKDEIEKKSTKITSSIRYASRIQKSMLPTRSLFEKHFDDFFVFYRPKETVSGDFFWLNEVNRSKRPSLFQKNTQEDKKVVLSVVDCTGHGVPGAFMSMLGDAYLNQIINVQKIHEPEDILYQLHKAIRQTLQQQETDNNDGMDVSLCVVDRKNETLRFAGAKNPIIYIQNHEMYRINGDLTSIGGLQKEKERYFTGHTIDISIPTQVYMYSDGYQDQFGGKYGRKFMAKPFRKMLYDNHEKTFEEQKEVLKNTLKKWKGKDFSQMDDITVVGFKV